MASEAIMPMENPISLPRRHEPWNKGRLVGQKRPLKPKDVWTIRVRLQLEARKRDLAMFNLAVDSKLRARAAYGRRCPWPVVAWSQLRDHGGSGKLCYSFSCHL